MTALEKRVYVLSSGDYVRLWNIEIQLLTPSFVDFHIFSIRFKP